MLPLVSSSFLVTEKPPKPPSFPPNDTVPPSTSIPQLPRLRITHVKDTGTPQNVFFPIFHSPSTDQTHCTLGPSLAFHVFHGFHHRRGRFFHTATVPTTLLTIVVQRNGGLGCVFSQKITDCWWAREHGEDSIVISLLLLASRLAQFRRFQEHAPNATECHWNVLHGSDVPVGKLLSWKAVLSVLISTRRILTNWS